MRARLEAKGRQSACNNAPPRAAGESAYTPLLQRRPLDRRDGQVENQRHGDEDRGRLVVSPVLHQSVDDVGGLRELKRLGHVRILKIRCHNDKVLVASAILTKWFQPIATPRAGSTMRPASLMNDPSYGKRVTISISADRG